MSLRVRSDACTAKAASASRQRAPNSNALTFASLGPAATPVGVQLNGKSYYTPFDNARGGSLQKFKNVDLWDTLPGGDGSIFEHDNIPKSSLPELVDYLCKTNKILLTAALTANNRAIQAHDELFDLRARLADKEVLSFFP